MNEQKLTKYLASYKEWLTKNPSVANEAKQERMEAQQQAHAFTKERLLNLSEDDLFEYLSPLWAMANIFRHYGLWLCGVISIIRLIIS